MPAILSEKKGRLRLSLVSGSIKGVRKDRIAAQAAGKVVLAAVCGHGRKKTAPFCKDYA
jgi:hypothetical protein